MDKIFQKFFFLGLSLLFLGSPSYAAERVINLTVAYKTVNFNGKPARAIAVNNQIPGPTLHFKEGDKVTINVYNHLNEGTSIHWHGVLVPWQMDGVTGISQEAIPPGGVFHYRFTLYQSGTYWYHAHEEFQEQQGLHGGIIIDPINPSSYHYTKDFVVVLSDWNNKHPEKVYADLKKEGDFYKSKFPLQSSLVKFIKEYRNATPEEKQQVLHDYKMMQQMRMSIYDFSDVAYDAYLLNGKTIKDPWKALVKVGDIVRLRFIGAVASTIYNVKIPNTTMKIVQVDGNDIKPVVVDKFNIAPGETYDVLVQIKKSVPYILYAESIDSLGHAVGALITTPKQSVSYQTIKPFPEPSPVTKEMMDNMMGNMPMNMSHSMNMPTESTIQGDSIVNPSLIPMTQTTPTTKYQDFVAAVKTNNPNKPIKGVIKMELFGYMERYLWFINGVPGYKAKPIVLEPGQRYRIIFTNTSMMHHPMHIHGHWFILRTGRGKYDPLLHTIDVPPGATVVADIDTDASGQWFFHCHQLYHMMAGMDRVFQYSTLIDFAKGKGKYENTTKPLPYTNQAIVRVDKEPLKLNLIHKHSEGMSHFYQANLLDVNADPFNNSQEITYKGLFGGDYNKLELYMNESEFNKGTIEKGDVDIFYWRLLSQFWVVKAGLNYVYRPAEKPYLQPGIGIEGLMPYFIDTDLRLYYHEGGAKADVEISRNTLIAKNFFIRTAARGIFATKTLPEDKIGQGVNEFEFTLRPYYQLFPSMAVYLQYQYTANYGETRRLLQAANESAYENRYSLGLSILL